MLTKQEMFDRAYRGLASQGWRKCFDERGCIYQHADGRRCAWGWVDMSLGPDDLGAVETIALDHDGIASTLGADGLGFAIALQSAHDTADSPEALLASMNRLAASYGLSIPELP